MFALKEFVSPGPVESPVLAIIDTMDMDHLTHRTGSLISLDPSSPASLPNLDLSGSPSLALSK